MKNNSRYAPFLFLPMFAAAAVLLFMATYARQFSSDDYCILRFLFLQNGYVVPGFFRPVGDLTLKWTYALFGWTPSAFFLINAVLHGVNSWLVYMLCRQIAKRHPLLHTAFPLLAGVLFLTYHSVGEVVLWAIGRGISLAVFFSLLSAIIFFSEIKGTWRFALAGAFYFIALSCYESVALLPLILLAGSGPEKYRREMRSWVIVFACTFFVNIALRYYLSGSLWAAYTGEVFAKGLPEYLSTFMKVLLRIFMPAINLPWLFVSLAVLVVLTIVLVAKRGVTREPRLAGLLKMVFAGIVFSATMSTFFGVSTRTGDGDRMLYFSAVFYSMLVAALLVKARSRAVASAVLFAVLAVQLYAIARTQERWNTASEYSLRIINTVREHPVRPLYIVNIPSDYRGAFIFRNCFREALVHHGIDTTGIIQVNGDTLMPQPGGTATVLEWSGTELKPLRRP